MDLTITELIRRWDSSLCRAPQPPLFEESPHREPQRRFLPRCCADLGHCERGFMVGSVTRRRPSRQPTCPTNRRTSGGRLTG